MIIDTSTLAKDEQVYLEMQQIFEKAGYKKFKMRKFEEYSLYLENKNFLGSETVITFNDPRGKLLALKPDVTLSIVKNAKATESCNEKVYYRENVYRLDNQSNEFREIDQIGLEFIGEIGERETLEICTLAMKSLAAIDKDFIFSVSHMGYVTALLDSLNVGSDTVIKKILGCLRSKNAHDLAVIARDYDIDCKKMEAVERLALAPTNFSEALATTAECCASPEANAAVAELSALYNSLKDTPYCNNIRLDFSILNDINYYNGIIFQGFTKNIPRMLLSGGRYDRLLTKFKKNVGAMGFALALNELNIYYSKSSVQVSTSNGQGLKSSVQVSNSSERGLR